MINRQSVREIWPFFIPPPNILTYATISTQNLTLICSDDKEFAPITLDTVIQKSQNPHLFMDSDEDEENVDSNIQKPHEKQTVDLNYITDLDNSSDDQNKATKGKNDKSR